MGVGSISPHELRSALKRLGYGVGAPRPGKGFAFVINKRTGKTRRVDSVQRYENIGRPLTVDEETLLCTTSKNSMVAAQRAEALMLGKSDPGSSAPDQDVDQEALIEQGVERKLAALGLTPDVLQQLIQQRVAAPAEAAAPPKKKVGRPKGSKNKPKVQPAPTADAGA